MSFSEDISQCEQKIKPKNTKRQQIDLLYDKLKPYHDKMLMTASNTTTERISREIVDVVKNVSLIDTDREIQMSDEDKARLNELNKTSKLIQPRSNWTWAAADDTQQGRYNDERIKLCITEECQWKIIECDQCGSTGILVGDQLDLEICYDLSLIHI